MSARMAASWGIGDFIEGRGVKEGSMVAQDSFLRTQKYGDGLMVVR
jgi:hypothetical protein